MTGRLRLGMFLAACLAIPAMSRPAAAQAPNQACPQAPVILATADFLLKERLDPPRFWRDREGADAAYIKIRYSPLDGPAARALIQGLAARPKPPLRIVDLSLAHAAPAERAAAIAAIPLAAAGSYLPDLGASALRAMVVEDGGATVVTELARWRDTGSAGPTIGVVLSSLPFAVAGLGDDRLGSLAARLDQTGFTRTALDVLSLRSDLSEAMAYMARKSAATDSAKLQGYARQVFQLAVMSPDFDPDAQPAFIRAEIGKQSFWRLFRPVAMLTAAMPDAVMVATLLNQTGDERIATELAERMVTSIEAGATDPARAPDAAMAQLVAGLAEMIGPVPLQKALDSFQLPYGDGSEDRSALSFADTALARAALAPIVAGVVLGPAAKPPAMSGKFEWERWSRVAFQLAGNPPIAATDRIIAASLLEAAGIVPQALGTLTDADNRDAARSFAHRMLQRLDRRCGALLSHPLPFREPLYRFE